jgi:hypothetical protein
MRYRPLDANGDYTVSVPFLANSAATVAQAIQPRLRLWLAEFFLDTSDGTPWLSEILGPRANQNPDAAIKQRILGTPGVTSILSYSSNFNGGSRALTVTASVMTAYSTTPVQVSQVIQ